MSTCYETNVTQHDSFFIFETPEQTSVVFCLHLLINVLAQGMTTAYKAYRAFTPFPQTWNEFRSAVLIFNFEHLHQNVIGWFEMNEVGFMLKPKNSRA